MHLPTHGGDLLASASLAGCSIDELLDFSANVHPLGPPPGLLKAARAAIDQAPRYPPPRAQPLRGLLEQRWGHPVVVGNGASELLFAALRGARTVHLRRPSYLGYVEAAVAARALQVQEPEQADVQIIARPNNPDGELPSAQSVVDLARGVERLIVVDESFLALTREPSCLSLDPPENLLVVTSLTKCFAIPGLRLGFAAGATVSELEGSLPPWTVNAPAIAAGLVALDSQAWLRDSVGLVARWFQEQRRALSALDGVLSVRGAANFQLVELRGDWAGVLRERLLLRHRVLIRDCSNFDGLNGRFMRLAVRPPGERRRMLAALRTELRAL